MDSISRAPSGSLAGAPKRQSVLVRWLLNDIFYIAMLVLALAGVVFRLPVSYWVILMPVFGAITISEGWRHFSDRKERLGLVYRVALNWCALLLALYLLFNDGVRGVMNANAVSLSMMTLLVAAKLWGKLSTATVSSYSMRELAMARA